MSVIVFEGSHGVGKSTIINNVLEKYDIISLKSIPDWYRKYLPFARSLPPEIQKQVYMIGHEANYVTFSQDKDYLLDRFFYTTIIRLNYELAKNPDETVKEILDIKLLPDAVIYLYVSKDNMIKRLIKRGDISLFDNDFFNYENEIYRQLSLNSDRIFSVSNDDSIDNTLNEINHQLTKRKVMLRRK